MLFLLTDNESPKQTFCLSKVRISPKRNGVVMRNLRYTTFSFEDECIAIFLYPD